MSGNQPAAAIVRCHSGYTYAQRPVAFWYAEQEYLVDGVLAESRFPDGRQFLVQTRDGKVFDLIYNKATDIWQVKISDWRKSAIQGVERKDNAE